MSKCLKSFLMIFEMSVVKDRVKTKLSLGRILITPNVICITTNFKEKVYLFCRHRQSIHSLDLMLELFEA